MIENLRAAHLRYGYLTVRDVALEVAFSGESWAEICRQAEELGAAKSGYYQRLRSRLGDGQTLNSLIFDALECINVITNEGGQDE